MHSWSTYAWWCWRHVVHTGSDSRRLIPPPVFEHKKNSLGGICIRTIGIARAEVGVTLMNLTCNLSRIELPIRNKTFGILISNDRQLTGGREPGPVIPGLPARAEPGIQGLLELFSGFRVPLRGPGMTG